MLDEKVFFRRNWSRVLATHDPSVVAVFIYVHTSKV
jgi:hypothetical protein